MAQLTPEAKILWGNPEGRAVILNLDSTTPDRGSGWMPVNSNEFAALPLSEKSAFVAALFGFMEQNRKVNGDSVTKLPIYDRDKAYARFTEGGEAQLLLTPPDLNEFSSKSTPEETDWFGLVLVFNSLPHQSLS